MAAKVCILGTVVDAVDFAATLDQIEAWVNARRAGAAATRQVCTVNPEYLVDARRNASFAAVLGQADLRVPDGAGVLWAARRAGQPLAERVTGSDGIYRISERAAQRGWRGLFLCAAPGGAGKGGTCLRARSPRLRIPGA